MRLFHFFYQQMLPNLDCIFIKTINAICRKFKKAPFVEPRLSAKTMGNPDIFPFICIPFISTCNDALELTLLTFLLLMLTPLLASWSVQSIRKSVFVLKFLASSLNKFDLLKIIIIYYNARCDNLLLHGDIAENPGPPLSYMHWNVNSLSADHFARIPLLQAHAAIHGFHLIAITESGLTSRTTNDAIDIPGYTPIRCDLIDGISHGGVVVYHKDDLAATNRPELALCTNTVVLALRINNKKVFFVTSYRKSGQNDLEYKEYMNKLDELLDEITNEDPHEVILTGDFNVHNATWWGTKTDKKGLDMKELLDKHSFRQMVNQPTYFTNGPNGPVESLLDLVCVRQPNLVVSNEVVGSIHDKCHHQINHVKINLQCFHPPPHIRDKSGTTIEPIKTLCSKHVECTTGRVR